LQSFRIIVLLFVLAVPVSAQASRGERYLSAELQYRPAKSRFAGYLHTPALSLGGGFHLTDFALFEGMAYYGLTGSQGALRHVWGGEMTLRLLIDATQWIPSIGPVVGWIFSSDEPDGFNNAFYLGAHACVDYRNVRSFSYAICGSITAVPYDGDFAAMYLLGFRLNGFLPYLFE
jgi:hypothetical protein